MAEAVVNVVDADGLTTDNAAPTLLALSAGGIAVKRAAASISTEAVITIVPGDGIDVDATDPANPIVSNTGFPGVTIIGTEDEIEVANGDGSGGNPTIGLVSNPIVSTIRVNNDGLKAKDTNGSHYVAFKPGSDITADRSITFITGDADRTYDFTAAATADKFATQLFHARHEVASGTNGGASTVSWNVRPINTVITNEIASAALASNQITLPAGTYYAEALGSYSGASVSCRLRLYNVTDAAVIAYGEQTFFSNNGCALLTGIRFTLAATKAIRLEQYTTAAHATSGLGAGMSLASINEVHGDIKIWKVA